MALKPALPPIPIITNVYAGETPLPPVKSHADTKDARILYQGLTQAALQSMPLGQFAPDLATHLVIVKAAVEELAAFIQEKSK